MASEADENTFDDFALFDDGGIGHSDDWAPLFDDSISVAGCAHACCSHGSQTGDALASTSASLPSSPTVDQEGSAVTASKGIEDTKKGDLSLQPNERERSKCLEGLTAAIPEGEDSKYHGIRAVWNKLNLFGTTDPLAPLLSTQGSQPTETTTKDAEDEA